ncbi:MAG: hypothetical protein ACP5NL_06320, partial [Thermoplasmata archaeon]
MIRKLYDGRMSISNIARKLQIDRKTVRKYAKSSEIPKYHRDKRPSIIELTSSEIDLQKIIGTYKLRWNIEITFKVQDQCKIQTKSKDILVRYFLFAY